jgi:hypothetical protein
VEDSIRQKVREAALAAIQRTWAEALAEQEQHWPDHAYRSVAEGFV